MPVCISVAIPVWNDAAWLPGAIESVLDQSYQDWEIVVGDNASTDDLENIVRQYADPRIHYHCWKSHVGASENHNRTMALCQYEWVQLLCADDRLRPGCLQNIAGRIERASCQSARLAMVVTACRRVGPGGRPTDINRSAGERYRPVRVQPITGGNYDAARWLLVNAQPGVRPWMIGSVAISRELLSEVGGFRPEMGLCHDLELAMRLAAYGDVEYIDEPLLDYTLRGDSISTRLTHRHIRLGSHSPMVDEGAAWSSALRVHDECRVVSSTERSVIHAAIGRAFIKRALLHRLASDGGGQVAAMSDIVRAAWYSPRSVLASWRFAAAVAAVLAPAWVIRRATALGHRLGLVVV